MEPDPKNAPPAGEPNLGASASPAAPLPNVTIPDHELLRCIGRGSYGEVWLARNMMGVYRAVKVVRRRAFTDGRPFERELSGIRKFEPVSRSHEGFIDVLHIGINEAEGYFYYIMELGDDPVQGQNIDAAEYSARTLSREISAHGKLAFQECLQLGLALSLALSELHKRGLVHRDVKPSNIIFVNGVPKLADIGLVAEMDEARSYVGTEGFIPPEGPGSPAADVYSLGKVLYEACTGKDRQDFPELPTLLDDFGDRDSFLELNEVILQACHTKLKERYKSAWEMHADLLVIANGKSVKRLKILEHRLASLKRLAGIATIAILVLAAVLYQGYREWRRVAEARQRQVGANVAYGNRAMEAGDLLGALPYFTEALRLDRGAPERERQHRLRIGSVLSQAVKLEQMFFTGRDIEEAGFSPDGSNILVTLRGGKAGELTVAADADTPRFLPADHLFGAVYSPDGLWIATYGTDGTATIWRRSDGAQVLALPHPFELSRVRFSPDGRRIVTACMDGKARVWSVPAGKLELEIAGHTEGLLHAEFSHDGRMIVTTSTDRTARIWRAKDGRAIGPPLLHGSWVNHAVFSPDDQRVVTGSFDHKAHVWDIATGKEILPELVHRDGVLSVDYSPDGRLILTACLDGTARLWRADNLEPLGSNSILSHHSRVTFAGFDSEGRRIITTCSDGSIRIWDLAGASLPPVPTRCTACADGSRLFKIQGNEIEVEDAISGRSLCRVKMPDGGWSQREICPDGQHLLGVWNAAQNDKEKVIAQVWNTTTGETSGAKVTSTNESVRATLDAGGRLLALLDDRSLQIWDAVSGQPRGSTITLPDGIRDAWFNEAGDQLAIASEDRLMVVATATGQPAFAPQTFPEPLAGGAFSPDGTRLLAYCATGDFSPCLARILDASTGKIVGKELQHNDGIFEGSFSRDGRRVVTACEDFAAYVWDSATGRQIASPLRHQHQVKSARFSRDGLWIVTASRDTTARIWSTETGDPLTPPLYHPVPLASALFLANGRDIIVTDTEDNSWIWTLSLDKRPVEDLVKLAQLLGPTSLAASTNSQRSLWLELRRKYPESFTISAPEDAAWHEAQARECEQAKQWNGAVFHLERLAKSRPANADVRERLDHARTENDRKSSSNQ